MVPTISIPSNVPHEKIEKLKIGDCGYAEEDMDQYIAHGIYDEMGRCVRCRAASHCVEHGNIRLIHRDRLKPSMWLNEHVIQHYRPPKLPPRMCVKSAFHWTNETINIWSHLIGFLYFSYCQFDTNFYRLPMLGGHLADHLIMTLSVFGAQVCMILSTTYHTFGCISPADRQNYLKLDVFGISAGLLGMYLSGIYTAFFCFGECLHSYLYFLLALFVVTSYVPTRRDFLKKKVIGSRIGYLHIIYSAIIIFGILPTIHWVHLNGGLDSKHVVEWLPDIVILYGLTGAAFFFYATLIPERLSPGTFDLVGCSHQWWHLLILAAMIWWQRAGIDLLTYYRINPDSCKSASMVTNSTISSNHTNVGF